MPSRCMRPRTAGRTSPTAPWRTDPVALSPVQLRDAVQVEGPSQLPVAHRPQIGHHPARHLLREACGQGASRVMNGWVPAAQELQCRAVPSPAVSEDAYSPLASLLSAVTANRVPIRSRFVVQFSSLLYAVCIVACLPHRPNPLQHTLTHDGTHLPASRRP